MTTPTLAWQADDHGTLVLRLSGESDSPYLYLQGRRPYCDRGHWEWGCVGIPADHRQAPSYYFMRLATQQAEIEAWLGRLHGVPPAAPFLPQWPAEVPVLFRQPDGRERGWAWTRQGRTATAQAVDPETLLPVSLTLSETDGPLGPVWTLAAHGVPNLDDSDRFPRIYMDAARALQEAEDFLAWRLLKVPCEHPHRFEKGDSRPVNADTAQALAQPPPPPARPRPKA